MQQNTIALSKSGFCWKNIGIEGDRSCVELREVSHCRNCKIYAAAGRDLLDQPLPEGYQDEWASILAAPAEQLNQVETRSLAIFRLQNEWFGLSAQVFQSVTPIVPIRRIPQRSNDLLLGIVNISGELQLCVSLSNLMGLPKQVKAGNSTAESTKIAAQESFLTYPRMVVIQLAGERWVFPVDDIYGIERFSIEAMKPAPANVSQFNQSLTQAVIEWRGHVLSYLDDELLASSLQRRAIS